jgi:hypothetical protein
MSRISDFLDRWLADGGEVVSLTHRPRFVPPPSRKVFWYTFLLKAAWIPGPKVRLEGLDKLNEKINVIRNRTPFNIAPQRTALQRSLENSERVLMAVASSFHILCRSLLSCLQSFDTVSRKESQGRAESLELHVKVSYRRISWTDKT